MKRKEVAWSAATLVLAFLSIWAVVAQGRNYSLDDLKVFLVTSDPFWLALAVICMLGYILFEGMALGCIMKSFGHPRKLKDTIVYSSADIYFSAITPSATGGQPACAYFMLTDGIPAAVSTVTLLLNLVMYTGAIMTIGIIAVLVQPWIFLHFSYFAKILIVIGYVALSTLTVVFIMLLKREDVTGRILGAALRLLHRLHLIKRLSYYEGKLEKTMEDYKVCASMIDGQRPMMIKAFLFNLIQRALQICVPVMVFLAGGDDHARRGVDALDIWVTQAFVTIGSNCVPIPGAVGVSDYLLLNGLGDIMTNEAATSMELASRGISFYFCVFFSLIVVGVGYFIRKRKEKKNEV